MRQPHSDQVREDNGLNCVAHNMCVRCYISISVHKQAILDRCRDAYGANVFLMRGLQHAYNICCMEFETGGSDPRNLNVVGPYPRTLEIASAPPLTQQQQQQQKQQHVRHISPFRDQNLKDFVDPTCACRPSCVCPDLWPLRSVPSSSHTMALNSPPKLPTRSMAHARGV